MANHLTFFEENVLRQPEGNFLKISVKTEENDNRSYKEWRMRCRICRQKAVIYMKAHRLALCKGHYPDWFRKQVKRAIVKFRMFDTGDRVLVAVSGGKDSAALWHALHHLGYDTAGLYLHLGIERENYSDQSREAVRALARQLNRPLHEVSIPEVFGVGIELAPELTNRPTCSTCGLVKRYHMNRVAYELGYTVVATGHNLDDEAVTLLNNILGWHHEYLMRQGPVLPESEGFARKVKPLIYLEEKQMSVYCLLEGIPFEKEECPFSVGSTNLVLKDVLYRLEYHSPGTKRRFLDGFFRWRQEHLSHEEMKSADLQRCQNCGYPTTGKECAYCRLKDRVLHHLQRSHP